MNCGNCGAAMSFADGRGYFRCDYCNTYAFSDPDDLPDAPLGCASQVFGNGAPGDPPPECPVCRIPLRAAVLDRHHVAACRRCRGMLLARGTFAQVVRYRRETARRETTPPPLLDPRDLHRAIGCPHCAARMETHPYHGPGNVVIDTCSRCDLVWMDAGELEVIERAP